MFPGGLENLVYRKRQYCDTIRQGLHERLQMRGGNGPCRCINGIWAHFGIFVDRFGHSLRCLRVHQEPLRRRMLL
jgi:hypothetical protein